jgi:hypothetical protein
MPRKQPKSTPAEKPRVIRTNTPDTLSDQLDGLTQALFKTQKEAQDAKIVASSAVANNDDLRKEIAEAKSNAAEASSANAALKKQLDHNIHKQEKSISFTSKGNEDQYNVVIELLEINFQTKLTMGDPSILNLNLMKLKLSSSNTRSAFVWLMSTRLGGR